MKRSKDIRLDRFNKSSKKAVLKPLFLAVAAVLTGCGSQNATVYQSVEQCLRDHPQKQTQCEQAYNSALEQSKESSPKYLSRSDCEHDFGVNNCQTYNQGGNNWFMPAMAGFMVARALDGFHPNRYSPVYTSFSRRSPYYGRWTTARGGVVGYTGSNRARSYGESFKQPAPKANRTIKRGGFGSTAVSRSRWGSSSRGGWGG